MKISKAVITAAARGGRVYPAASAVEKAMMPVVDADGLYKPVIQVIAEEAISGGVEEICIVCVPGDEQQYISSLQSLKVNLLSAYKQSDWAAQQANKIDELLERLSFAPQPEARGYGHAVLQAKSFTKDEPFLLLLGDYLYRSKTEQTCAAQLTALAGSQDCAVSAVNPTKEYLVGKYGTLTGKHAAGLQAGVYEIEKILEKPSLSEAEMELQTPGLRMGYYLCFFGMHVLTPAVYTILEEMDKKNQSYGLTDALDELITREKYLALEVRGQRYDTGRKFGMLKAQIALSLSGNSREEMLATIVEEMAESSL